MPEWLTKILETIKYLWNFIQKHFLSILFFIFLLGTSILVSPVELFRSLQIENLRSKSLEFLGAAIYLSAFGLCFILIYKGHSYLLKRYNQQKLMQELTPKECEYMIEFFENNSQTATFSLFDGVVAGLVDKGILYKPDSKSNLSGEQDFNLYPWAYKYIRKHKNLYLQGEHHVQRK